MRSPLGHESRSRSHAPAGARTLLLAFTALIACGGEDAGEMPADSIPADPPTTKPAPARGTSGVHSLGTFFVLDQVLSRGVVEHPWIEAREAVVSSMDWEVSGISAVENDEGHQVADLEVPMESVGGLPVEDPVLTAADGTRIDFRRPPSTFMLDVPDTEGSWFTVVPAERRFSFVQHPRLARGFPKPRTPQGEAGVKLVRKVRLPFHVLRTGREEVLSIEARFMPLPEADPVPRIMVFLAGERVGVLDWEDGRVRSPQVRLPAGSGVQELALQVMDVISGRNAAQPLVVDALVLNDVEGKDRLWAAGAGELGDATLRYRPRCEGVEVLVDGEGGEVFSRALALQAGTVAVRGPEGLAFDVSWCGQKVASADGSARREAAFALEQNAFGPLRIEASGGRALNGPITLVQPRRLHSKDPPALRGRERLHAAGPAAAVVRHTAIGDEILRSLVLVPGSEVRCPVPDLGATRLRFHLAEVPFAEGESGPAPRFEVLRRDSFGEAPLFAEDVRHEGWGGRAIEWAAGAAELVLRAPAHRTEPVFAQTRLLAVGNPRLRTAPAAGAPNVLIYLIDTLRADHLHHYGYERETSPNLDALAADGVVFESCFSQSPWTRPSIATVFTGLVYSFHGAGKNGGLAPQLVTLAERLHDHGYQTAAFVSNAQVHGEGLNFEQGFQVFEAVEAAVGSSRASDVNARALPWLEENADQPFFVYMHTLDPHARYDPPTPTRGVFGSEQYEGRLDPDRTDKKSLETLAPLSPEELQYLLDLYDEEILFNDLHFGRVVASLKEQGVYEDTVIVVLSDHGEEFGAHGGYGHGGWLWQDLLHVPLVWKLAGEDRPRGLRLDAPVRIADVLPTLAGLLGLEDPGVPIHGIDLGAAFRGESLPLHDVIAEEEPGMRALLQGSRKMIDQDYHRPQQQVLHLYDLERDPSEQDNLAAGDAATAERMRAELARSLLELGKEMDPIHDVLPLEMSDAVRRALIEMGYLDEDGGPGAEGQESEGRGDG